MHYETAIYIVKGVNKDKLKKSTNDKTMQGRFAHFQ